MWKRRILEITTNVPKQFQPFHSRSGQIPLILCWLLYLTYQTWHILHSQPGLWPSQWGHGPGKSVGRQLAHFSKFCWISAKPIGNRSNIVSNSKKISLRKRVKRSEKFFFHVREMVRSASISGRTEHTAPGKVLLKNLQRGEKLLFVMKYPSITCCWGNM